MVAVPVALQRFFDPRRVDAAQQAGERLGLGVFLADHRHGDLLFPTPWSRDLTSLPSLN